jgi:Calpain family cysteine protease
LKLKGIFRRIFGSYAALIGGRTSEALQQFTGGITDFILLKSPNPVVTFENLLDLRDQQAFMGAAIFVCIKLILSRQITKPTYSQMQADENEIKEFIKNFGLVPYHAYSLTDIQWVEVGGWIRNYQVPLVRLRNPWGRVEWKGPWSDG